MHAAGTIHFFFSTGQLFSEGYIVSASNPSLAMDRLEKIAKARLPLLATNVRIVCLRVPGEDSRKAQWPGTGGEYASPRSVLLLRQQLQNTRKKFRGVPEGVWAGDRLNATASMALTKLNALLRECGHHVKQKGKLEPAGDLVVSRRSVLSHSKGKKTLKRKLVSLLGKEVAEKLWAEIPD